MDTDMDVKCEHQLSTDLDALKRAESSAALPAGLASSNTSNFSRAIASCVKCGVVLRLDIPLFWRVDSLMPRNAGNRSCRRCLDAFTQWASHLIRCPQTPGVVACCQLEHHLGHEARTFKLLPAQLHHEQG